MGGCGKRRIWWAQQARRSAVTTVKANKASHSPAAQGPVAGVAATQEVMHGAYFKEIPDNWTDFKKPHTRQVPPPKPDTAAAVCNGTAEIGPPGRTTRKIIEEPKGHRVLPRKDLYANMTFKPLDHTEQKVRGHAGCGIRAV